MTTLIKPFPNDANLICRTGLKSGNLTSAMCYAARNIFNANPGCWYQFYCFEEHDLKKCLSRSGEPDWWKDFPDMDQQKACDFTNHYAGDSTRKIMGCS